MPLYGMKRALGGKFQQDVLWNVASLVLLGVSGIIFNILIWKFYDTSALGVFNQVFAAYTFFSQFAVTGLQFSTLKHISEHAEEPRKCSTILFSALLLTGIFASIVTALFWLAGDAVGGLLGSPGVAVGIRLAAPGLFFFSLNKVLLAVFNGFRRMKLFAVMQALRPLLMITAFLEIAATGAPSENIAVVFTVSELILFLVCLLFAAEHLFILEPGGFFQWLGKHFVFGFKSLLGGVLGTLNTRVDVLMLGYFSTDEVVGIYSFAAILAEGFFQLLIVFMRNYNPIITKLLSENRIDELIEMFRKGRKIVYLLMVVLGLLIVAVYPAGSWFIDNSEDFISGWPIFAILAAGIVLASGYVPFGQILLGGGKPGWHTIMISSVVMFNILANLTLIPLISTYGAALATALAFVFSVVMLKALSRLLLKVPI